MSKKGIIFFLLILLVLPRISKANLKGGTSFETAVELFPGQYEENEIYGQVQRYFFVNVKSGQEINLKVSFSSDVIGIVGIELFDDSFQELLFKEESAQNKEEKVFTIRYLTNSEKENYKFYVLLYTRLFKINNLKIDLSFKNLYDSPFLNDVPDKLENALPIKLNQVVNGYLSGKREGNDEFDVFKLETPAKKTLYFKLTSPEQNKNLSLEVFNLNNKKLVNKTKKGAILTSRYFSSKQNIFIRIGTGSESITQYKLVVFLGQTKVEKKQSNLWQKINFKYVFGIIFLILIVYIGQKVIRSIWEK